MNTKLRSLLLATLLAAAAATGVRAQATDPLSSLPASDVVLFIDARRIMNEIAPTLLASDPETLGKMTAALNEVRTKTGFNVMGIERIAVGARLLGPMKPGMKKENVGLAIIARGDFDANALIAFLKREGKGKQVEETYGGKIIYSEPRPDPPARKHERELAALTVLDPNTIVIGDLPQVRATVDAAAGTGRVDQELLALATRDSSALVGLAGNVPPELAEGLKVGAPKDEMAQGILKLISSVKQIFGSLGATATDFNMIAGARLASAEQAQSVSDMLLGIRQKVAAGIPDPKGREMVNALQITAQGDQLQLRMDVKMEVVQHFIASAVKKRAAQPDAKTAAPAKKSTTTRRGRRRARR